MPDPGLQAPMQRDSRARAAMLGIALLSAIAFVMVASNLPVAILGGAGHDDAWFWQRADAIATGSWLGRYDQYTLMKGSGYPMFLAVGHALGLPVTVAQALLYALACLLLGHAAYQASGRLGVALVLVLAVQWHPAALSWSRVLRDNVSAAQVLLVLACLLQVLWGAQSRRGRLAWATLGGWSLAWFWTTREDGIWLLPGIALLVLAAAWQARRTVAAWKPLAAGCACMAMVFAGWLALVATANGVKYGDFGTVDVSHSAFGDALAALQGVRAGEVVPFVPVPAAARTRIYEVSPSFERLRDGLEAGAARKWTLPGCDVYPHSCGDYAGGWFMWALRDAAAGAGVHGRADMADAFYRSVADEVAIACGDGRLDCDGGVAGLMPAVTAEQQAALPGALGEAASLLAWQGVREAAFRSDLAHADTARMWRFLGRPWIPDRAPRARASGWFRDPQGGWIQGRCGADGAPFRIQRQPSADLAAHFDDPAAGAIRFAFELPAAAGCAIELQAGRGQVPLSEATAARMFTFDAARLQIDDATGIPPTAAAAPRWPVFVKEAVGAIYSGLLPLLAIAGLAAFALALLRASAGRASVGVLLFVAAAAWGLVASRALLLALVDISAFPAVNAQYMQPAFPLLVLAAVASLAALRTRVQQQRNPPRPP